jgi:hypothetical protein
MFPRLAMGTSAGYVLSMSSVMEIQEAPVMSEREEAALLARLDRAAAELDAGKGVPLEQVRGMVGKWASK